MTTSFHPFVCFPSAKPLDCQNLWLYEVVFEPDSPLERTAAYSPKQSQLLLRVCFGSWNCEEPEHNLIFVEIQVKLTFFKWVNNGSLLKAQQHHSIPIMAESSFWLGDSEREASKPLKSSPEPSQESPLESPLKPPLGNSDGSKCVQDPLTVQCQCPSCGKLFNSNRNLKLHEKRQHSDSKSKKAQSYSNSFKLEVLEKVEEVGIVAAQKLFGIPENTIKG